MVGLEQPNLLACTKEPNSDLAKDEEPVEAAIWKAMGELAQVSQASVIDRTGVFVRLEAIRTEKHQTRYQPLQPYMDEKSILEHARPWKQVLMFFARTQRAHDWRSPTYRFTRRQQDAWDALVEQAERGEEDAGDEGEEELGEDELDEEMDEEMDGEDAAYEPTTAAARRVDPADTPALLSKMQRACLRFCIKLLN